jgi:beta-galactosidase
MPGFGRAMPEELHRADAELIRSLGLNFVRLSHYPQHPAFIDACDEMGLMVYAEIATWKSVKRGAWLRSACRQFSRMILRDRNHPCIILWGMGNESRDRTAYLKLRGIAENLDPARPVTYAENHHYRARRQKTLDIPDVWGANYELDMLEAGCDSSRMKSVVVAECSNCPHARRGDGAEELRQVQTFEQDLAGITAKPFVAGYALWSFNDYSTLRKERYRRESGIVDAWRNPKMSAALLRAMYLDRAFVSVHGDWGQCVDSAEAGSSRIVHIFTNCEEVTVLRNGLEIFSMCGGIHTAKEIEFEPGQLVVRGLKDGCAAEDSLLSYGVAARVETLPDKAEIEAAGYETVGVTIRIVDEQGHQVCSWNGDAVFSVAGEGAARCYREDGSVVIRGGMGRCFVMAAGSAGVITVRATAGPLCQGTAEIRSVIPCAG